MRIANAFQSLVLPVDCQCILAQVVGSDTEEIHMWSQQVAGNRCRRRLDHDTKFYFSHLHIFSCQLQLHFLHDLLDLFDLFDGDDHREHDAERTESGGTE